MFPKSAAGNAPMVRQLARYCRKGHEIYLEKGILFCMNITLCIDAKIDLKNKHRWKFHLTYRLFSTIVVICNHMKRERS